MAAILPIIGLVAGVLLVTSVATRFSLPAPIVLVLTGLAVSFIPGVPSYEVHPEIVLFGLLPPLLYGAAYESSAIAIRKLLRPIVQLAVVLVLLTAFSVAFVVTAIVPGVPFAAALALGAIVAPPDAVAAVAVARRVGLPRRLLTVLEGESLFNDATSLVTLKVAIAAIGASSVAWAPALGEFAWAAGGGVAIGVLFGLLLSFVRRHAGSPLTITAMSLVTPFAAYLIGEEAHASGVLVVVVTGLILGHRSPTEVAASVRLTETATWAALRFVLEGAVFALIGLELRAIMESLDTSTDNVFLAIGAVLLTVVVSRPVWVGLIHAVSRLSGTRNEHVGRRGVAAISWAGMRGVVSLAAAQTLPLDTPFRSLLMVCTITVILGTLVLQGLSLPWVIRRLGIAEDTRADDLAERAEALTKVSEEIHARVDALCDEGKLSSRQAELMRKWASLRDWRNWEDDQASREFARRLSVLSDWRRTLVAIEREVIVGLRNSGELSENVLAEMQHDLDLEEAWLTRRSQCFDAHLCELAPQEDPGGSGRPDAVEDAPSGAERAIDRDAAHVDEEAVVDDADVSALLLDEQRAEGTVIGQRPGRSEGSV